MAPTPVSGPDPARRDTTSSPLMAILRAERAGLSQQAILTELRRAILSGDVAPGSPVPVDEVADLFGVSRIPIRESLKTLIGEGLVDHQPRAGYTVARLTAQEFRELYVVRGVLEIAALSAAIDSAGPDDDRVAAETLDALDRAIRDQDYRAYQRESRHFHLALAAPCRMPRLMHMIELVWNITEPIQPMAHIRQRDRDELHAEHREMLDAFTARDRTRLLRITRQHLDELESTVSDLSATDLFDSSGG
ncbi:MAG TPA: GntR family transcriptional regulator [Nakamurella sp.]